MHDKLEQISNAMKVLKGEFPEETTMQVALLHMWTWIETLDEPIQETQARQ